MSSTVPPNAAPKGKKADALIGSVVNGKYRILSLVASGGMGKIYQAEQIALGRSVALKVLHTAERDAEDNPQFKKRFFREASILARLQHPNVVTIFDYGAIEGTDAERYFISMEYLSGETLARRISERGSLSTRDTVRVVRQLARGLTEAHAYGIIHRDLKPSNVMLLPGRDGEELAKIVDFGIVKIVGDESDEKEDLTQEGSFIGSPKYMAPEQIARGGKIDARTDIYSFGIILYQCLTGTVPFDGASSIQTLMAHLNQPPDPMRERSPGCDVPNWLDELVMSCIEKEPSKRPQTMEAVARTLAEAEAALNSNHLVEAAGQRPSAPPAGPDALPPSSGTVPARQVSSVIPQGSAASSALAAEESEKTRTSPGVQREADSETERGRKMPRSAAALGAALGVAVLGVAALGGLRHEPPIVRAGPLPSIASTLGASAVSVPLAPAGRFTLRLDSTPSGADVREGDRVLGATPIELSLDNEALRTTPRSLSLVKDGFAPYPVVQGPSADAVRVHAELTPLPVASPPAASGLSRPAASPASRRGAGKQGTSSPSSSAPPPNLEIRMNR